MSGLLTKRFIALLFVFIALLFGSTRSRADEPNDALFTGGNEAYLKGDYAAAIDAYERLLAAGVNHEDLHYNLANAYVQADRLGPAIHHYELALELDPTQEDARANLSLTRKAAEARFSDKLVGEQHDPVWMRALRTMAPGTLTLAFLGLYMAVFALALSAWLLPSGFARVVLVALLLFALLAAAATGGLLSARYWLSTRVEQAIVLPDELSVKEGPDASYQTSFLVHAGLKVRVMEHDGDWVRVRLANGLEGWTRDRDVGRL